MNNITKAVERLDSDVRRMPLHYVNKEDYRTDIREMKEILNRIDTKIDGKADKH